MHITIFLLTLAVGRPWNLQPTVRVRPPLDEMSAAGHRHGTPIYDLKVRLIGQACEENQLKLKLSLEPCSKHHPNKLTAPGCGAHDAVIDLIVVPVKELCHG